MRLFCLNFHRTVSSHISETFLRFTPQLQFREPGLLWGDITATAHRFGSSSQLLAELRHLCESLGQPQVSIALGDSLAGTQLLSHNFDSFCALPNEESQAWGHLPIAHLRYFEGVTPLPREIHPLIEELEHLGYQRLEQLQSIAPATWIARWGLLGKRLSEQLFISKATQAPLPFYIPREPLVAYHYFDFTVSLAAQLHQQLEQNLEELWHRMLGRGEIVRAIHILLVHEFEAEKKTVLRLTPKQPTRDLQLVLQLWQERLHSINLLNPIQELEIELITQPHSSTQLCLDEPMQKEKDDLLRLQSLLAEKNIHLEFLSLDKSPVPEHCSQYSLTPQPEIALDWSSFTWEQQAHRELPCYGQSLNTAPRPTRLLQSPEKIAPQTLLKMQFLHPFPLERMELAWQDVARDYWVAWMPDTQQCLWVYRDLHNSEYAIHGYFD